MLRHGYSFFIPQFMSESDGHKGNLKWFNNIIKSLRNLDSFIIKCHDFLSHYHGTKMLLKACDWNIMFNFLAFISSIKIAYDSDESICLHTSAGRKSGERKKIYEEANCFCCRPF